MSEGQAQSVLRCAQCNKPFDKQSTLKRHGYYCRSRKAGSTSRVRSCVFCARGKAKCDSKRPQCSRCISKAIECQYAENSRSNPAQRAQNARSPNKWPKADSPSAADDFLGARLPASEDDANLPNDLLSVPLENLGEDLMNWDAADFNFTDFLEPHSLVDNIDYTSPEASLNHQPTFAAQHKHTLQSPMLFPNQSISPTPSTYSPRSLVLRRAILDKATRSVKLTLGTLNSYPRGIVRDNTLPPFIHPLLLPHGKEDDQMEPLNNCMSLLHMVSSGIHGSKKLFWRNVRTECEYMRAECSRFSKWGLLAAMQALSIYTLSRLCEGETEHNNFDVLLLSTIAMIAKQFACIDVVWTSPTTISQYGLEFSWKEWLFEESRRRLVIIYRVVNMLVHFEPAAMCELQNDLLLAPLPAKKELWEASDPYAWKVASEKDTEAETTFALAANGELVRLEHAHAYCADAKLKYQSLGQGTPMKTAHWEEWCSGMDGFGGLIMLAASLVG